MSGFVSVGSGTVLEGLVAETWAIDPQHLVRLFGLALAAAGGATRDTQAAHRPSLGGSASQPAPTGDGGEPAYQVVDGVAHIPIRGYLLKSVPAWMKRWGIDATSLSDTVGVIERADQDPSVRAIVLDVDSPGGTISGTMELGEAVAAAKKPTAAHGSGMVASAAYWIASQADRVTATPSTAIGSIGVYRVLYDTSAAYEKWGVKVHVVRTHELKGAGVDGSKLTEAQLAAEQVLINSAGDLFQRAVASGRKMQPEAVKAVATGEVWFAQDAQSRGLIDGVEAAQWAHDLAATTAANAAEGREVRMNFTEQKAQLERELAEHRRDAELAKLKAEVAALKAAKAPQEEAHRAGQNLTDEEADQRIARALGISVEKMERYGHVKAVLADGRLLGKDGVIREFKKGGA